MAAVPIPFVYRSPITAQASAAITTGADSAGAITTIDNTIPATSNGRGCNFYTCFVDVTVAPSGGDATARIKSAGRASSGTFKFDNGSLSVNIPDGETGQFRAGIMVADSPYSQAKLAAEDFGFTGSLIVVPVLPEGQ